MEFVCKFNTFPLIWYEKNENMSFHGFYVNAFAWVRTQNETGKGRNTDRILEAQKEFVSLHRNIAKTAIT